MGPGDVGGIASKRRTRLGGGDWKGRTLLPRPKSKRMLLRHLSLRKKTVYPLPAIDLP